MQKPIGADTMTDIRDGTADTMIMADLTGAGIEAAITGGLRFSSLLPFTPRARFIIPGPFTEAGRFGKFIVAIPLR